MARLIIDIGNTTSKLAVFDGDNCNIVWQGLWVDCDRIREVESSFNIEQVGVTAVGRVNVEVLVYLRERYADDFLLFDHTTPIPIDNQYHTKQTLGSDRILAAIAAQSVFKGDNVLVVDFGSAITIDIVTKNGEYLGGNISPGVGLRFKSLNEHTENLPLCEITKEIGLYGKNTNQAIEFGVINGIVNEIEGYIRHYKEFFGEIEIVFTGGDSVFFANKIESSVFVDSKLVLVGLNCVIDYNVEKK